MNPSTHLMPEQSLATLKQEIHQQCMEYVRQRIETAQYAITSAQAAGQQETKSSAGDKFETSREMMKQEVERNQQLLSAALQMQHSLQQLDPGKPCSAQIAAGSLIQTDQGLFYLAVGIGKFTMENQTVLVLSPSAPVGQLLLGQQEGDTIRFNKQTYRIQTVC